jgi:hypothetical protein
MDHTEAAKTAAIEKYLLGELPESQREAVEEHFFSCPECAEQVRLAAVFHANARAVLKDAGSLDAVAQERRLRFGSGWLDWAARPAFAMAAGMALVLLIGYQNLVQIPQLRNEAAGGSAFTVLAATEVSGVRAATDLSFSRQAGQLSLFVPHEWEEFYSSYNCELERRPGSKVVMAGGIGNRSGDFSVLVHTAALAPGKYVLNVYGVRADGQKTAVARFPLTLTD